MKKRGADVIAVVSANDPFVMSAWGKANAIKGEILMLSDPNVVRYYPDLLRHVANDI